MAAQKDKMIPSEKERKRALKYATPAGTGRMWVTMGIAFIIFGIILLLILIGLVISEASAQRYDPESIHTATLVFYLLGAFFGFCGCFCVIFGKLAVKAFAKMLSKGEINYPVAECKTPKRRQPSIKVLTLRLPLLCLGTGLILKPIGKTAFPFTMASCRVIRFSKN